MKSPREESMEVIFQSSILCVCAWMCDFTGWFFAYGIKSLLELDLDYLFLVCHLYYYFKKNLVHVAHDFVIGWFIALFFARRLTACLFREKERGKRWCEKKMSELLVFLWFGCQRKVRVTKKTSVEPAWSVFCTSHRRKGGDMVWKVVINHYDAPCKMTKF